MTKTKTEILKDVLIPLAVLVFAVCVWQIAASLSGAEVTPLSSTGALFALLGEGVFWRSLAFSLLRAFVAFCASFLLAFLLAFLAATQDVIERVMAPVITVVRSIPTLAIVLLLIVTLSSNATTVVVGLLVLFPSFYATLLPAVKGVSRDLVEISLVCGANRWQRLIYVYLPSMAPVIEHTWFSGMSLSLKLIVSAEVLAQTASSIGMMMQTARAYLELERLLSLTVAVVIVCLIIDAVGSVTSYFAYKRTN